ncbi:RNase adapter RapZ [Parerythrobacter jejuensis]|uniref:RNase adapter RapZ n=1 Tax=Parerythrobacter jejuensis TaxID=795812 RepID=A0A845AY69_9SPHN|nr:RNase adapter RapZ [Parerythrobacter jejuensis]MXP31708.1 RNase adapter RapZ [Parerythrobacter jejuensis]
MSSRQNILLVTGMSGAGKTTTLRVLEDMGWEALDNFPIRLLKPLIVEAASHDQPAPLAIGFDSRTRGFVPTEVIDLVKELVSRDDLLITTLFLDCSSGELERRFNETRRRHPMAKGHSALEGIRSERELMEPMRRWAESVIDTSELAANELQQLIREQFDYDDPSRQAVTISSFGFARGMPPLADLVFDMRFLDNPHWVDTLREQTGLDAAVGEFITAKGDFDEVFQRIRDLVLSLLPRYRAQGKAYVHIAFGCTGGRHRSVFTAETMAETLREAGFSPTVIHRNLASRAADQFEGPKA